MKYKSCRIQRLAFRIFCLIRTCCHFHGSNRNHCRLNVDIESCGLARILYSNLCIACCKLLIQSRRECKVCCRLLGIYCCRCRSVAVFQLKYKTCRVKCFTLCVIFPAWFYYSNFFKSRFCRFLCHFDLKLSRNASGISVLSDTCHNYGRCSFCRVVLVGHEVIHAVSELFTVECNCDLIMCQSYRMFCICDSCFLHFRNCHFCTADVCFLFCLS